MTHTTHDTPTRNAPALNDNEGTGEPVARRMMPMIVEGLERLTPDERRRLDAVIGPEAVFLLTKAYGPEIGALLWPHMMDDTAPPGDGAGLIVGGG